MSATKIIKKIMLDRGISVKQLAEMLGKTQQVVSNKLYRDTFTYDDYVYICNLLDYDVKTVSRDSQIEYINEYNETKVNENKHSKKERENKEKEN